jgi:hypothetical protein
MGKDRHTDSVGVYSNMKNEGLLKWLLSFCMLRMMKIARELMFYVLSDNYNVRRNILQEFMQRNIILIQFILFCVHLKDVEAK